MKVLGVGLLAHTLHSLLGEEDKVNRSKGGGKRDEINSKEREVTPAL